MVAMVAVTEVVVEPLTIELFGENCVLTVLSVIKADTSVGLVVSTVSAIELILAVAVLVVAMIVVVVVVVALLIGTAIPVGPVSEEVVIIDVFCEVGL